ncbi:hypothetical protein [Salidesulfovibrio onnuriiensis]|uniref:hypothetical protein n=1 Tax=Salidesulfovibrio onnuriiensis TaxID=2583823 RepID=UPI0011C72941|nr:hypothetical protein [Salidesulfovibrio onnuriiensis]
MSRKAGITMSIVWGISFCIIAVGGGLGFGFLEDMGFFKPAEKPVELSPVYSFTGPVQPKDLHLSREEIRALNRSSWRNHQDLAKTEIKVSCEKWDGVEESKRRLVYTFQATTEDGQVVESRLRETSREDLVRELERQLDVASGVLRKCRKKFPNFKKVYM